MLEPIPHAETFVGTYSVHGVAPDGTAYNGTLRFDRKGRFLHAEAQLAPPGVRYGLAMPFAGRLVMAFGPKDKVEIGAYTCHANAMNGLWVPPGASGDDLSGCGTEESASTGTGVWLISRAVAIDGQPYSGSVAVSRTNNALEAPAPVRIDWKLHDGEYHSFGLQYDDALYTTFSFEPQKPHGIIVYEIDDGLLSGTSIDNTGGKLGSETLTRS